MTDVPESSSQSRLAFDAPEAAFDAAFATQD